MEMGFWERLASGRGNSGCRGGLIGGGRDSGMSRSGVGGGA